METLAAFTHRPSCSTHLLRPALFTLSFLSFKVGWAEGACPNTALPLLLPRHSVDFRPWGAHQRSLGVLFRRSTVSTLSPPMSAFGGLQSNSAAGSETAIVRRESGVRANPGVLDGILAM